MLKIKETIKKYIRKRKYYYKRSTNIKDPSDIDIINEPGLYYFNTKPIVKL